MTYLCPDCGNSVEDIEKACSHCGCPITEMEITVLICPECKREVPNSASACPNCGYPMSKEEVIQKQQPKLETTKQHAHTSKSKSKRYRFIAAGAVVVVSIVAVILMFNQNKVTKTIEIATYEDVIYCDEVAQISACVTAEGEDITKKTKLNWKSSNPNVVTVDDNGNITGISAGTAIVTVSTEKDPSVEDTIEITVGAHVSSVAIDEGKIELLADSAMAYGEVHYTITPENAYCQDVVMLSSDENVVTVDNAGKLSAVAPGTATITVTPIDTACTQSATCEVTVRQAVKEIRLNHNAVDFYFGDELNLTAEIIPENANDKTLTWTSSDESVATVSEEGNITAISVGETDITCTANDGSGISATCTLTIVKPVEAIELSENSIFLLAGASEDLSKKQIVHTVIPEDATYQTAVWTSSDESVATVDANGVVTAINAGKSIITARTTDPKFAESLTASCEITVGNAVQKITFEDIDTDIAKGTSKKLKATITPAVVHNSKLTWSSSDETVLKVDANGNVRGVGVGNAKITCAATDGSGVVAEKKFFVYQPVTGLRAEETGNIILFEGKDITLHAIAAPEDATNKEVEWTSDNTSVATVDSSGCVTGKGKGSAVITATTKDGSNRKCTFRVYVEPAVPVTVESLGFGIYNGNLLGITVKNQCSKLAIKNFDFDIELESYYGTELDSSGTYNLGSDVYIGAGSTQTIKRTLSGVSWTQKVVITITGVEFTDGTFYSIPWSKQETWSFRR